MSLFKVGVLSIVVIALFSYFGFTKANPFANPYELQAVFEDAKGLQERSPVRIAGVDVGIVSGVESVDDSGAARVTMEIEEDGLPIHRDAELKIRPRILLEGNFFVDLEPGSAGSDEIEEGELTIPVGQTSTSVSLDEILAVLESDVRDDLRTLLFEYGTKGLDGGGAQAFNDAIPFFEPAYRRAALNQDALLGLQPRRDIQRFLDGQQRVSAALASNPRALQELVTDFNTVAGALASEDDALQASVPALRDTLQVGMPALASLNASLPTLRIFAREALPGVRSSVPTLAAALPWIRQARALMQEDELKGLAADLRQAVPGLVRLNVRLIPFLNQIRALSSCTNRVLVPWAEAGIPSIEEGNTNQEVRRQIQRSFVGLSGESRVNDANTPLFHVQAVAPENLSGPQGGRVEPAPPFNPNVPPPHRPDVPCETQEPPNLNAASGPPEAFPVAPGGTGARPSASSRAAGAAALEREVDEFLASDEFDRLKRSLDRLEDDAGARR